MGKKRHVLSNQVVSQGSLEVLFMGDQFERDALLHTRQLFRQHTRSQLVLWYEFHAEEGNRTYSRIFTYDGTGLYVVWGVRPCPQKYMSYDPHQMILVSLRQPTARDIWNQLKDQRPHRHKGNGLYAIVKDTFHVPDDVISPGQVVQSRKDACSVVRDKKESRYLNDLIQASKKRGRWCGIPARTPLPCLIKKGYVTSQNGSYHITDRGIEALLRKGRVRP